MLNLPLRRPLLSTLLHVHESFCGKFHKDAAKQQSFLVLYPGTSAGTRRAVIIVIWFTLLNSLQFLFGPL